MAGLHVLRFCLHGLLIVGVDLLPAKDREKEKPYVLEANATPGFGGIEKVTKDKSVTQEIFKTYLNRENWRK